MKLGRWSIRIKRPQRSPLHAVAHLSLSGVQVFVYRPIHSPGGSSQDDSLAAEGHAPLTLAEGAPPAPAVLTNALRSATADLPGPIHTFRLVIPAAQCRMAQRTFPAGITEPEAHTLAAQMATQIASELGHTGPIAFDWRHSTYNEPHNKTANEITICVAPRDLIASYLDAVHTAGLHCIAITPTTDPSHDHPELNPFNLLPWRNTAWLQRGHHRIRWLVATTLLAILPAVWVAADQASHEQTLNATYTQLMGTLKARQIQQPDIAKLRQQLAAQQAAQNSEHAAREATMRQQQTNAARLDRLAITRPQGIRFRSLSYDAQGMQIEGLAQTTAAITQLLKNMPCARLSESHRDTNGPLRFVIQFPVACTTTP